MVVVEGIEPTPPKWLDFESGESTSSPIPPLFFPTFIWFLVLSLLAFLSKFNLKVSKKCL